MLNSKELGIIVLVTLILGFVVGFNKGITLYAFAVACLFILIVLLINIIAKKIAAHFYESEIEVKIWQMQRYGFRPNQHLNKPIPIGIFAPIILAVASIGNLKWLASLSYDIKPKVYRSVKRHGLYSFSEMTEWHIGVISAIGIFTNLIAAVIFYFLNLPDLSRLNVYYAFFNMIPFDELDGNKIFFGSIILWSFLAALTLIAIGYALLL